MLILCRVLSVMSVLILKVGQFLVISLKTALWKQSFFLPYERCTLEEPEN